MASIVEQIKSRLSIADVVGGYLKLEKAGSNWKARCPFHNEKTASFFVSPSRDTYHCFGCSRGGDIFSFVEEIEGVDFSGALRVLAERAGVDISAAAGHRRPDEKLFAAVEEAAEFFSRTLSVHAPAREYLAKRGVLPQTVKSFRLGYAPNEWRALTEHLRQKGFTPEILERAGLAIKSEKASIHTTPEPSRSFYDRFRGRIMFPIMNASGRIVGFSGRILPGESGIPGRPPGVSGKEEPAKYLNSPETEIFHKSRILYGFDRAKQAIRKENRAVLVEGQFDLVLSHQGGVAATIASSGTALTREHLLLIRRLADTLILAFDADDAGLVAAKRGIDLSLAEGFDVRVASLPQGSDPADLVVQDPALWRAKVEQAEHVVPFLLKALAKKGLDVRTYRLKTSELVLPYIARIRSAIERAHFVSATARALTLPEDPIWEELKKIEAGMASEKTFTVPGIASSTSSPPSRFRAIERKVRALLLWQGSVSAPVLDVEKLRARYEAIAGENVLQELMTISDAEKNDLMFEAEASFENAEQFSEETELLFANLEEEVLKGRFAEAMEELRVAEREGATERSLEILRRCQEISRRLKEIVKK